MQHQDTGTGWKCAVKCKGTWKFEIEDEKGITRTIKIPNTLYCKEAPYCLLSPQHWSQQSKNPSGTYCKVGHKFIELIWKNSNLHRKIKIDPSNNCGIIWSTPGYSRYSEFMAMSGTADNIECIRNNGETSIQDISIKDGTSGIDPITPFNFDFDSPPTLISDAKRNNNEIMQWHIRLNHLPFRKLRLMASMGMIPKRLSKTSKDDTPICASCLYGEATRRPWRNNHEYKHIKPTKIPGECVSIDLFESSTKGLIGQIKGRLMRTRYTAATVFVDHRIWVIICAHAKGPNKCRTYEVENGI